MPRIIQPNQVVTYKKKITLKEPTNTKPSFWEEFFKTLAIQVLGVALGVVTAGIGTAIVAPLGFTQLGIAATSFVIQSTVNFATTEIYDVITGNASTQSTLMNLLFSITDIGQFGRALKYDKLLKLTNEARLYEKIGINTKIKNFYQLKQHVLFKDVIIGKSKLAFKKKVTDVEILNMISVLVKPQTKKVLKAMTVNELNLYLSMQKLLHKINPKLVEFIGKSEINQLDTLLKKYQNLSVDDFFKMNDLEASNVIYQLGQSPFGLEKIVKLNNARIQSKFQENFLDIFKRYKKTFKAKLDKINPIKMMNKIVKKIFEPINQTLAAIKKKTYKIFSKWDGIYKGMIKKLNLIPCHPESFLLGFSFEPTTISGEGFCTIYKKPYISLKTGKVSNYNSVRVWTNLLEVEQFATQPDGNSQSIWYNENWALGPGFGQKSFTALKLISPGLAKTIDKSQKLFAKVQAIKSLATLATVKATPSLFKTKFKQAINNNVNSTLSKAINIIPGANLFTSAILKLLKGKKVSNKDIYNPINKRVIKRVRKVRVIYV